MLSAIFFAIKMVLAAAFVVLLSLGKGATVPRSRVGFYSLLSVVTAAITAVSQVLNSGMLAGAVFVVIGFIGNFIVKLNNDINKINRFKVLFI